MGGIFPLSLLDTRLVGTVF